MCILGQEFQVQVHDVTLYQRPRLQRMTAGRTDVSSRSTPYALVVTEECAFILHSFICC